MKIDTIIKELKEYDPERVILFGSQARGDAKKYSDFDLLIIKKTKTKPQYRFSEIAEYLPLGAIDAIVYTPEEFAKAKKEGWLLMEEIERNGKEVYAKKTV